MGATVLHGCIEANPYPAVTTHGKHAQEIIEKLPLDDFDAVVVMSGDGLVHEVFNGYAKHAEPRRAFRTPVTPIPTGSGNGLSLNLLGLEASSSIVYQYSSLTRSSIGG